MVMLNMPYLWYLAMGVARTRIASPSIMTETGSWTKHVWLVLEVTPPAWCFASYITFPIRVEIRDRFISLFPNRARRIRAKHALKHFCENAFGRLILFGHFAKRNQSHRHKNRSVNCHRIRCGRDDGHHIENNSTDIYHGRYHQAGHVDAQV